MWLSFYNFKIYLIQNCLLLADVVHIRNGVWAWQSSSSFDHLCLRKVHTHNKPEKSTNTPAQPTGSVIPYRDITSTRSGPYGAVHVFTICIVPNRILYHSGVPHWCICGVSSKPLVKPATVRVSTGCYKGTVIAVPHCYENTQDMIHALRSTKPLSEVFCVILIAITKRLIVGHFNHEGLHRPTKLSHPWCRAWNI